MIESYPLFAMSEKTSWIIGGEHYSMELSYCLTSNDFPYSIVEVLTLQM